MTITIELPEDVANRAAAAGIDLDQVQQIATVATVGAVVAVTDRTETEEGDPEIIQAGREALYDLAHGRTLTLEEADADLPPALAEALARRRSGKGTQQTAASTAP